MAGIEGEGMKNTGADVRDMFVNGSDDIETDVIILGSGAAGLTAALSSSILLGVTCTRSNVLL